MDHTIFSDSTKRWDFGGTISNKTTAMAPALIGTLDRNQLIMAYRDVGSKQLFCATKLERPSTVSFDVDQKK